MAINLIEQAQQPGWNLKISKGTLTFEAPDEREANKLIDERLNELAYQAFALKARYIHVKSSGSDLVYRIPATLAAYQCHTEEKDASFDNLDPLTKIRPLSPRYLADASYREVLEFMANCYSSGLAVVVASLTSSMDVLHANSFLGQKRILMKPANLNKVNNPLLWRDSMHFYNRLVDLLEREGFVPNYYYEHYRTDNSRCGYEHDFYYIRDFLGVPCRLAVSHADAFQVISTVTTA